MQLAIETGEAYRTRLDPPPADATVAHGPRVGVDDARFPMVEGVLFINPSVGVCPHRCASRDKIDSRIGDRGHLLLALRM